MVVAHARSSDRCGGIFRFWTIARVGDARVSDPILQAVFIAHCGMSDRVIVTLVHPPSPRRSCTLSTSEFSMPLKVWRNRFLYGPSYARALHPHRNTAGAMRRAVAGGL